MKKVYLDNCALQRPLDDKIQTRLRLEAEAEVDYFCTCDNPLLKKARASKGFKVEIVTPLELIEELDL